MTQNQDKITRSKRMNDANARRGVDKFNIVKDAVELAVEILDNGRPIKCKHDWRKNASD